MYTPFHLQCEAIDNTIGESVNDEHVPAILDVLERLGCYVTKDKHGNPYVDGEISDDDCCKVISDVIDAMTAGNAYPDIQAASERIVRAHVAYSVRLSLVVCRSDMGGFLLYTPGDWNNEQSADYEADDDGTIRRYGDATGDRLTHSEMANAF